MANAGYDVTGGLAREEWWERLRWTEEEWADHPATDSDVPSAWSFARASDV